MTSLIFKMDYSYDYGVFVSRENKLGYIPILKNAHSWGKEFFKLNFDCNEVCRKTNNSILVDSLKGNVNDSILTEIVNIVILRDPIQRWLAGTVQYLTNFVDMDLNSPHIQTLIRDGLVFDYHTSPQFHNLLDVDLNKSVFFMCDNNLENNLNLFCRMWLRKPVSRMAPSNTHKENPKKDDIYPIMKNFLDTDELLQKKLSKYYERDFSLINQLKSGNRFVDKKIPEYLYKLKQKTYNKL